MRIQSSRDLLLNEVQDLYDAEKQLLRQLPRIAKKVSHPEMAEALRRHSEETRNQVARLEQVFEILGQKAKSHPCLGMKGLLSEASELLESEANEQALDCAMAGASRRVEHYEMAAYLSAQDIVRTLGHKEAVQLLEETLREEKEMDKLLKQLSGKLLKELESVSSEAQSESAGNRNGSQAGRKAAGSTHRAPAKKAGAARSESRASSENGGKNRSSNGKQGGDRQIRRYRKVCGTTDRSRNNPPLGGRARRKSCVRQGDRTQKG